MGGNSLWLTSPKKKKKNPFAFSERVYVYSSCFVSQSTSGKRAGSFFLTPKNNKAVIHFCPRVISWDESPGNSLFPVSSLGEGLFPKGSVLHIAQSFKNTAQHRMRHMWGRWFPPLLSMGKRKLYSQNPFSGYVESGCEEEAGWQAKTLGAFELGFRTRLPIPKVLCLTNI